MGNKISLDVSSFEEVKDILLENRVTSYCTAHPWKTVGYAFLAYAMWDWMGWIVGPKQPPGPLGVPFLGNMLQLSKEFDKDIMRFSEKYGDIYQLRIGPRKMVILSGLQDIKEILVTRGADFADRNLDTTVDYVLGMKDDVFLSSYSPEWVAEKKLIVSTLRQFGFGTRLSEEIMQTQMGQVCQIIQKKNGQSFHLRPLTQKCTTNIILKILMNYQFSYEDDPAFDEFMEHVSDVYKSFVEAFMLDLTPRFLAPIIARGARNRAKERFDRLRDFEYKRIEEHRENFDPENPRDFLDAYMAAKKDKFNPEAFVDTLQFFYEDASHTLAMLVEWVMLFILTNPEVQDNIHKELDKVVGKAREPALDDRKDLGCIDSVNMEIFRILNLIPMTGSKVSLKDAYVKGYFFPKGTCFHGNLTAIHQSPENYPEPELFKADRFLDSEGKLKRTDTFLFFGMGPRKCIGEPLALQEMFMIVATLFHRFKFTFDPDEPRPEFEGKTRHVEREPPKFHVVAEER